MSGSPTWEPPIRIGTWHPMGGPNGPVRYEQRVNGQPTGMFFVVPRAKYWSITLCSAVRDVPVVGAVARWWLRTTRVMYQAPVSASRGES